MRNRAEAWRPAQLYKFTPFAGHLAKFGQKRANEIPPRTQDVPLLGHPAARGIFPYEGMATEEWSARSDKM